MIHITPSNPSLETVPDKETVSKEIDMFLNSIILNCSIRYTLKNTICLVEHDSGLSLFNFRGKILSINHAIWGEMFTKAYRVMTEPEVKQLIIQSFKKQLNFNVRRVRVFMSNANIYFHA